MLVNGTAESLITSELHHVKASDPTIVNYGGFLVSVKKDDYRIEGFSVIKIIELSTHSEKVDIPDQYMFK